MARTHTTSRVREEDGQSIIIVTLAMAVVIALAAFAIDASNWYATHHRAQVTADAMALAAANYMAKTPSATAASAEAQGEQSAFTQGSGLNPNTATVVVDAGTGTATATVKVNASGVFAGFFGLQSTAISAKSVAHYGDQCVAPAGSTTCISLFAGNNTCPTPAPGSKNSPPSPPIGLDLVTNDSGGGNETITGAFSNGYYYNGANSGSSNFTVTGVPCSTDYPSGGSSKNTTFTSMSSAIPYPQVWSQPTCTYTASYWTTATTAPAANQITSPGVYCITGGVGPAACADDMNKSATSSSYTAGAIYVGQLTGSGYEFVGPCVTTAGSTGSENIAGQPLIYGTSNITTPATSTALPTCTANTLANGSTYIDGNNTQMGGYVYDQCGTAVVEGNGTSIGFIEAWNIDVLKNNVTGDGPNTTNGLISYSDQLVG